MGVVRTWWGELTVSVTDAADRPAEEADLVAQIAAGDTGSPVSEQYRRYGRRLYGFGLQCLGNGFGLQCLGNGGLAQEMVREIITRCGPCVPLS
jgi:hypothetical protein